MFTTVAAPLAGSEVGIGGATGLNSARGAGPSPRPKMVITSPGTIAPWLKLAEFTTPRICGPGPKTTNCASFDTPPPGVGVVTAMRSVPGFARYVAGTVTKVAVSLTVDAVNGPVRPTEVGVPLKIPTA